MRYHLACWSVSKRNATKKNSNEDFEGTIKTACEIELLDMIQYELNDPSGKVLDMNNINIYQNLLYESGMSEDKIASNYKQRLKQLIKDNIPQANFVKSTHKNKPEQVISESANEEFLFFICNRTLAQPPNFETNFLPLCQTTFNFYEC